MADFLDEKRSEIGARLKELRPLVEEYRRLQAAAAALDGAAQPKATAPASTRRRASSGGTQRGGGPSRRGRSERSGTRATQALALVRAQPGITIPDIAEKMAIKQSYLYRVLPGLAERGLVRKDGRGWHPKDAG